MNLEDGGVSRPPPSTSSSKKMMTPPINVVFRCMKDQSPVSVWLYENTDLRIEGRIQGFDEFMNLVLFEAVEVSTKRGTRRPIGRILLKGENVTCLAPL